MTEQEMRELDAWIAEHGFGWRQVETVMINGTLYNDGPYWWPPSGYGDPLNPVAGATVHDAPLPYSRFSEEFQKVKREIERRGWFHAHELHPDGYTWFRIWKQEATDDPLVMKVTMLGEGYVQGEELAGCLAFKAAVEAKGEIKCLST